MTPENETAPVRRDSFKDALSRFVMVFAFMFVLLVMFDPSLRSNIGKAVGVIFEPAFGFGGAHPIWTLFFAGLIMIFLSTLIRNIFVDWIELAKVQKRAAAYQKAMRAALHANNTYKVKKLKELQPEMLKLQSQIMPNQMKPMAFTMLIVIPIFAWLSSFIYRVAVPTVALPWCATWKLTDAPYKFPNWVLLYMLISMSFGQAFQHMMKLLKYKAKLAELDVEGVK